MSYPQLEWTPYFDNDLAGTSDAGYARYANLSSARALWDGAVSAGAAAGTLNPLPRHMMLSVKTQNVRAKFGADPTSTEGQLMTAGNTYFFDDVPDVIRRMRLIEETATAEVTVTYFY